MKESLQSTMNNTFKEDINNILRQQQDMKLKQEQAATITNIGQIAGRDITGPHASSGGVINIYEIDENLAEEITKLRRSLEDNKTGLETKLMEYKHAEVTAQYEQEKFNLKARYEETIKELKSQVKDAIERILEGSTENRELTAQTTCPARGGSTLIVAHTKYFFRFFR